MAELPSREAEADLGFFDRFAGWVATQVARAPFFAFCVLLIVAWAPSLPLFGGDVNVWQLTLNSPTTAITFLLVALLQNTTSRADRASQSKLNAIADSMADLLEELAAGDGARPSLAEDARELREAVGLEDRVAS
jgi:low affinity Fe/Cu permease